MVKQELIDRSPVRHFDKALSGGVKAGQIGVLASKKGLGKTSVLVQIGLDMLLQDKEVIHVSFNQQTSHVMVWYEDIFAEISKKKNLDKVDEVKDALNRKRIVLNFNQESVKTEHIINTLRSLFEGGIKPQCVIVDGLDFSKRSPSGFIAMKKYAKEAGIAVWYSCDATSDNLNTMMDAKILEQIDAVMYLESTHDGIHLKVLKAHGKPTDNNHLKLDSKTLLMADK